jgi:hypothetical protein
MPLSCRCTGVAISGLVAALLVSEAAASSHVVAFSSTTHFSCGDADSSSIRGVCAEYSLAPLAPRAASDLLRFLSGSDSADAESSLPAVAARLSLGETTPELVLAVTETAGLPVRQLLASISDAMLSSPAVRSPSSFASVLDGVPSRTPSGRKVGVSELERMAADGGASFVNGKTDTLSVEIGNENERAALLASVRMLVDRSEGRFAVVWTASRVDKETEEARESALKGGAAGEAAAEAVEETEGVGSQKSEDKPTAGLSHFNADGTLVKNTSMDPPLITTGALVGLIVAAVLLMILLPGLMCLYNIQAPQSFDYTMDRDEAKKKLQ